jgi:uncharacterized membrane protein
MSQRLQHVMIAGACALPGLVAAVVATLVPQWADIRSGAVIGAILAACAGLAGVMASNQNILGALGWRLGSVLIRIAGTALAMALLVKFDAPRPAVAALIAAVAAGWLVEMAALTVRLAQERKPVRG